MTTMKRIETTVELCLDGSLYAEWKQAQAELEQSKKKAVVDDRLNSPVRTLAAQIQDLEAKVVKETVTFTVRAMSRKEWREITLANPPREGNDLDKNGYGFNVDAVMEAAIPRSVVAAAKSGRKLPDAAKLWAELEPDMSESQYDDFAVAVLQVNRGRMDRPFSYAASLEMQASATS